MIGWVLSYTDKQKNNYPNAYLGPANPIVIDPEGISARITLKLWRDLESRMDGTPPLETVTITMQGDPYLDTLHSDGPDLTGLVVKDKLYSLVFYALQQDPLFQATFPNVIPIG